MGKRLYRHIGFRPDSSLLVQSAFMLLVVIYLIAFAWTMWRMANDLQKSQDALHMLSQTDALSGLKNRSAFESALGEKFSALQAGHGKPQTALLLATSLPCCWIRPTNQEHSRSWIA